MEKTIGKRFNFEGNVHSIDTYSFLTGYTFQEDLEEAIIQTIMGKEFVELGKQTLNIEGIDIEVNICFNGATTLTVEIL